MKTQDNLNTEDVEIAHNYELTGNVNLLVQITDKTVFDVVKAFDKYATWNFAKVVLLDHGQLMVTMDFGRVPRKGEFVAPNAEDSPADNLLTGNLSFLAKVEDGEGAVLQSIASYSTWMAMVSLTKYNSLMVNLEFRKILNKF